MSDPFVGEPVLRASISELSMMRWDLATELEVLSALGFGGVSLWRTKLSDVGVAEARKLLRRSGIRVSSLQWAGGFTGSDGRTFRESVDDAWEAIRAAAALGCGVLVVHPGCRGGHTLGHAHRLLCEAMEVLAPAALDRGVRLAIQPFHPGSAPGCGFLTRVSSALEWVDRFDHPGVGLALDLWQFAGEPGLEGLVPDLVPRLAVVKVADREGPPSTDRERLLPGAGSLPLDALLSALVGQGYRGWCEFEVVGEAVEVVGYREALGAVRRTADTWGRRFTEEAPAVRPTTRGRVRIDASLPG